MFARETFNGSGVNHTRRTRYFLLNLALFALFFVGAAAYVVRHAREIEAFELRADLAAGIAVLTAVNLALMVFSVQVLIRGMKRSPTFGRLYLILTASLAVSHLTPLRLGIPMKIWLYKKNFGLRYSEGAGIVSLEIFLPFMLVTTVGALGISALLPWGYVALPVAALTVAVLAMILSLTVDPHKLLKKLPISQEGKIGRKFLRAAAGFQNGLAATSRRAVLISFLLFALKHCCSALRLVLICRLFGVTFGLLDMIVVLAASQVLGTVSVLPMGLGVVEAAIVFLLSLKGVPAATGLSVSVLQRLLTSGLLLLLGAFSAPRLGVNLLRGEAAVPLEVLESDKEA